MTVEELKKLFQETIEKAKEEIIKEQDEKRKEELEKFKGAMEDQLAELRKPQEKKDIVDPDGIGKDADPKCGFKDATEFFLAVKKAASGYEDKRLSEIKQKAAGTGLSEGDAEYGGYLIPPEFKEQILKVAVERSNILSKCTIVPMATNAIQFPYVNGFDRSSGLIHGGIKFYWVDEEGAITSSRPKVGKVELRLKKVAGLCYLTDEILQDSPVSMRPLVEEGFPEALAYTIDNVLINGTGAGQPLGVLNAPCLVEVAKEDGQDADTIVFENIVKMYARIWRKKNGEWYANDDTFPQLATMSLAVGTGGAPVWLPAGAASGKPYDTLMGKPLNWMEHCQTLGDKGDIILADFSQYLVGQKAGAGNAKFDTSIHVKFEYDQVAYRFIFRIDGQPWWPSALTPRYSSATLSPFVTLAART